MKVKTFYGKIDKIEREYAEFLTSGIVLENTCLCKDYEKHGWEEVFILMVTYWINPTSTNTEPPAQD